MSWMKWKYVIWNTKNEMRAHVIYYTAIQWINVIQESDMNWTRLKYNRRQYHATCH